MKITTIFDKISRPDTIGIYVDQALKQLGHEVYHYNPSEAEIPIGVDLFIMVDDGQRYQFAVPEDKTLIYWAIDTHISMGNQVLKGKKASRIFAAQQGGARELSKLLNKKVEWLPVACDPELHIPYDSKKIYDVGFIGTCNFHPAFKDRLDYLDHLFKHFPNFDFGTAFGDEMPKRMSRSKIVVNKSIKNDLNMKFFEILSTGNFLLTDYLPDIEKLGFKDGVHLALYRTKKEMVEKAKYYLDHSEEREKIAKAGREKVIEEHTYKDRMKQMLKEVL